MHKIIAWIWFGRHDNGVKTTKLYALFISDSKGAQFAGAQYHEWRCNDTRHKNAKNKKPKDQWSLHNAMKKREMCVSDAKDACCYNHWFPRCIWSSAPSMDTHTFHAQMKASVLVSECVHKTILCKIALFDVVVRRFIFFVLLFFTRRRLSFLLLFY